MGILKTIFGIDNIKRDIERSKARVECDIVQAGRLQIEARTITNEELKSIVDMHDWLFVGRTKDDWITVVNVSLGITLNGYALYGHDLDTSYILEHNNNIRKNGSKYWNWVDCYKVVIEGEDYYTPNRPNIVDGRITSIDYYYGAMLHPETIYPTVVTDEAGLRTKRWLCSPPVACEDKTIAVMVPKGEHEWMMAKGLCLPKAIGERIKMKEAEAKRVMLDAYRVGID